ncbi:MAG: SDR family oxidoreductase [Acidobacteria bacterium]|nr:MAG: SDR family oxidoreductase [Acidobacteriota bacterium]
MRVKDKVAIVTGAGSGIGRATAELLAEEGAKVVVADVDPKGGKETVSAIHEKGNTAYFVQADISREADAKTISDETVKMYSRIDILVNNAATFVLKGFEASFEDWQQSLGVNVIGTVMVTKYTVEHMKKKGGSIVILGSISSFLAQPDFFAYSATKAAMVQLCRNMAMDLGPYKIRVNAVCPGSIITAASYRHMEKVGMTLEEFDAQEGAKTFVGRAGKPREVAAAILFLASDEASYITGSHLMVDGGYSAQ